MGAAWGPPREVRRWQQHVDPKDSGPRWGGLLPNGGNPPGKEAPKAPGVIHQPVKELWIEYHIGPP